MVNANHHPWILTGPWYRWKDPFDNNVGRQERPVFQKYDTSDLVNEFIQDPQHSLKFTSPDDVVRWPQKGAPAAKTPNDIRKLYLDTHKRFYLVVCELHCDLAGFPNASRTDACEAGFVIRRRMPIVPKAAETAIQNARREVAVRLSQLTQLEELPQKMKSGAAFGLRAEMEARYVQAQAQLLTTAKEFGVKVTLQGWVPDDSFKGIGSWKEVHETPQEVTEHILPLYPLIPDPRVKHHSGGGRTIYFGLVPTGSSDVDLSGNPRFDDRNLYEVRCFVRRHNPRCPRRLKRNDCHGEIVWSRRTETYMLANPFDLSGTSNRPINILLPDLPALEAQAASLKPGQGAPVRMIAPPKSNLEVTGDLNSMQKETPTGAICSFSIPLITIVASFVLRLFLPIVMFLFGLWFLLKLKFCIPPMVDLGPGLALDLDAAAGNIEAGVDVDVAISDTLFAQLQATREPSGRLLGSLRDQDGQPFGKKALADFALTQSADFSASLPAGIEVEASPAGAIKRQLPSATAGLEYEIPVIDKA